MDQINSLADLHNSVSGAEDSSFLSSAADWLTKGVPLAVGSGVTSMLNTGISLGNAFGADAEKIDFGAQVASYDDDLSKYYTAHQGGIDLGGFLATSLVPGVAGIKALKMAQGGIAGANAAAEVGLIKNTGSVLGYFRDKEAYFVGKSLDRIRAPSNEVFSAVDNQKLLAIAAGAGDQALQGAAFQTAVLLTMNQSPVLSKEDEGYFTSLLHNSPEILTAGLLQGVIGGGLGGLGIAGKLKKAIYDKDIAEFPSRHYTKVGTSDVLGVDPGTGIAADFSFWSERSKEFADRKIAGDLTDVEINRYEKTLKNQENDIRLRITNEMTNKDGTLGEEVWKSLLAAPDSEEATSLIFSAAKSVKRIGTENQPAEEAATQIFTADGPLVARHAENILKRAEKVPERLAPEVFDNPTDQQLKELQLQGRELYKTSDGNFHIVEDSTYAKSGVLERLSEFKNSSLIVKLSGDNAGRVTETAYPVAGDLGKVGLSEDGRLTIDKNEMKLPEKFDPIANSPVDSNMQFLQAKLKDFPVEEGAEGLLSVGKGNLPLLEKTATSKTPIDVLYAGEDVTGDVMETLRTAKLEARADAMNAGHDFKRIARELNVTEDFAETGQGDGFLLNEDHTKPMHAAVDYETSRLPDGFHVRGIASLMSRIELGYELNASTVASVLGPWAEQLPKTKGTLLNISTTERFSSFLTSHSPDYGGFGMVAQQSGKVANSAKAAAREEVLGRLNAYDFQVRSSPEATLEVNQVVNKVRSSKEKMFVLDSLGDSKVFVPESVYKLRDADGFEESVSKALADKTAFRIANKDAEALLLEGHAINQERATKWNQLFAAMGSDRRYNVDEFYLPPINTRKYSYVAFVKERMDMGTGSLQEAGVISAPTREVFEAKVNQVRQQLGDRFEVKLPDDIQEYKKIRSEYEDGPMLGDSMADSAMKKEGLLYDFQPRTDAEILNDLNQWHYNQEGNIINQAIELHYAQEFAELRAMGKEYTSIARARFGAENRKASDAENPYLRYVHTALDISDFDRYNSLWGKFNDVTEGIAKKMFSVWDTWNEKASLGEVDWQTANKMAESYGFTAPYKGVAESVINPKIEAPRNMQGSIAKMNGAVSTLTLGLDFLNSVINVISMPIMALSEMKNVLQHVTDPKIVGELSELTSVRIPGSNLPMPTPMKLLGTAIKNMVQNGTERGAYYEQIGAIRTPSRLYTDVVDASRLTKEATETPEGFKSWTETLHDKARTLVDAGKSLTGYNKAEWTVRFLAADMMRQITDMAGISATDAPAYINAFTNRVHGNYLANQRPHLFQGMVGQAISLFQTYQFNIMQNMVRFVESGDKTAAATLFGLQNTIFGLQGNPFFYALNQRIGAANDEHTDIVTGSRKLLGDDLSNWLVYGLGSNVLRTSLYNRGDLTPRYVTVVPTKIEDIPAIAIPAKAISSFIQAASNIVKGGDVTASLLDGVAHFGANRPIAGLAQVAQGYRTTSKGDLMTAYNDLDGIAIASKLAGGEEINRAIAIDAYYRNLAYKKADTDAVNSLGEAVKTTMYKGQTPTQDQTVNFMNQYVQTGGNAQSFNRWLMQSARHANQSQMNAMMQQVNSRAGRQQALMMGGDQTPDFWGAMPSE